MRPTLALWHRKIPLKRPFKTSLRSVEIVEDFVIVLTVDGVTGYGSAAPTPQITGDSAERIVNSLVTEAIPLLKEGFDPGKPGSVCSGTAFSSCSARYMMETALYDLSAVGQGKSLAALLGGSVQREFVSDITISRNAPDIMAADSLAAVQDGFTFLKIKVGDTPELDIERLRCITQVIPDSIKLRIDANQAWDANTAVSIIESYRKAGFPVDLIEQPVPASDLEGLRWVKEHSSFPIMADESIFGFEDAVRVITLKAADIINIKLSKCGGITDAVKICNFAEKHEIQCMIGCMMEGVLGILAAAQLSAARTIISRVDLDSPMLYRDLLGSYDIEFNGQQIIVGEGLGIGVVDPVLESGGWPGSKLWEVNL
jgi:L-Ala-D/L-Glu epimerase / N-acetyl-D-glutamate racemase